MFYRSKQLKYMWFITHYIIFSSKNTMKSRDRDSKLWISFKFFPFAVSREGDCGNLNEQIVYLEPERDADPVEQKLMPRRSLEELLYFLNIEKKKKRRKSKKIIDVESYFVRKALPSSLR